MISQKCPKCRSKRVRRGYRKTSIFLKLICRFHLLCDNCNWEFIGFAVPGTVSSKPKRRTKKTPSTPVRSEPEVDDDAASEDDSSGKKKRIRKKVRVKFQ